MNKIIKAILEYIPIPIWVKDLELKYIYVNKAYANLYNKEKEYFMGLKNEDVFDSYTSNIYNTYCNQVIQYRETVTIEKYVDNELRQCCIFPAFDEEEELIGIAGIIDVVNIGKIKEQNDEIEFQKNLTKQIIDILPGVIFYKDKDNRYVYANEACRKFYKERGIDNIIGKTDLELNANKELAIQFMKDDKFIIDNKKPIYKETIFEEESGKKQYREVAKMPLIDELGNVSGIVGRSIDITEKKLIQERLRYLSYTDILTGVNNRTSFEERIKELSKEENLPLGIIMADANGLKLINDTLGHEQGDYFLKLVANIFKDVCNDVGEVFRVGGDEFIILISKYDKNDCKKLIKKINKKCKSFKGESFNISISLGYSVKVNNKDVFKVIKEAEDKMYMQKQIQDKSIN
ncbi:MAG: diguanylate cyclase domain-containing protein [Peptostreptococcaceae bacterium]